MKKIVEKRKVNIVTTFINRIITTVCGIIVPRVLIGSFGSEMYGITVSITQFLSYISLLESGIGGVARGELYEPLAKGDKQQIGLVYYSIKRFFRYVAAIFICYAMIIGISYKSFAHVTEYSRIYIFVLAMVISISTLVKYMGGLANLILIVADQKQYINNAILIFTTIVNTLSIIVLVWLKCDIIWVKLGSSLIFVIRPLLYTLYVRKHYNLTFEDKKAVLEQKWTGIGQHIAFFLHTNTDIVLLTLFADIKLIAVYSVYNLIISSIRAMTESFTGGMEAAFGEAIAKKQAKKLQYLYKRYNTLLVAVTMVLFSCTGILIVPFVKLYTSGIEDVNYIEPAFALVLLFAEAINCLVLPYSSLPIAANRLRETKWGAYGEAVINIVVSCILVGKVPLFGVTIGTLMATIFRGIFYMCYSTKHILKISTKKVLFDFAAVIVIMCITILIGRKFIALVEIESYFKWTIYGVVTFAVIGAPVGVIALFKMKRIKELADTKEEWQGSI